MLHWEPEPGTDSEKKELLEAFFMGQRSGKPRVKLGNGNFADVFELDPEVVIKIYKGDLWGREAEMAGERDTYRAIQHLQGSSSHLIRMYGSGSWSWPVPKGASPQRMADAVRYFLVLRKAPGIPVRDIPDSVRRSPGFYSLAVDHVLDFQGVLNDSRLIVPRSWIVARENNPGGCWIHGDMNEKNAFWDFGGSKPTGLTIIDPRPERGNRYSDFWDLFFPPDKELDTGLILMATEITTRRCNGENPSHKKAMQEMLAIGERREKWRYNIGEGDEDRVRAVLQAIKALSHGPNWKSCTASPSPPTIRDSTTAGHHACESGDPNAPNRQGFPSPLSCAPA